MITKLFDGDDRSMLSRRLEKWNTFSGSQSRRTRKQSTAHTNGNQPIRVREIKTANEMMSDF